MKRQRRCAVKAIAPNNLEITGTLEVVTGRGLITFCGSGEQGEETEGCLSFCFNGETEIFWEEQKTARTKGGLCLFLDEEGGQWTEKDIILVPNCFRGEKHADPTIFGESAEECTTCRVLKRCKPAKGEKGTTTYDVHIYTVVRVKVPNVHANSQKEAIRNADVDLYGLFDNHATGDEIDTEYAEEQAYYFVDEAGDEEHERSRWHDGEFHILDDVVHRPIPCTTA
jgi:hypothetical protein